MSVLLEIFIRPGKVFARVRERQIFILPFLAVVFLLTLPTVMVIYTAGMELLTFQRYQHNPKLTAAVGGEGGVERAVNSSNERYQKVLVVSRVAGTAAVSLVLLAAVFMAAARIFDKRPTFFTMLGTLSFSAFPFALAGAVISLIMLLTVSDNQQLDLENMPALNLGRLLDRATSNPAIFSMASDMDLLIAGEILFMSYGLTKITGMTYLQAITICGSIWALAVLWQTGLSLYF